MTLERLHKVMANAGIASRRACEQMIAAGRVRVNGQVVTEMGHKVDPGRDRIEVDGQPIRPKTMQPRRTYLMLYKPAGYLSEFEDSRGRPGLEALVKSPDRLYPVGRLDLDSEGLILVTNDGELAQRLSHPRYEHSKVYLVQLDRRPGSEALAHWRRGIQLEDGMTAPAQWSMLDSPPRVLPIEGQAVDAGAWLKVVLREGRKRQIRRMAAAEGLRVLRLIRVGLGPLSLDRQLKPGDSRPLTRLEVQALRSVTQEPTAGGRRSQPSAERWRPSDGSRAHRLAGRPGAEADRPARARPAGQPRGGGEHPPRRPPAERPASSAGRPPRGQPAERPRGSSERPPRRPPAERPRGGGEHPSPEQPARHPRSGGQHPRRPRPASDGPTAPRSRPRRQPRPAAPKATKGRP